MSNNQVLMNKLEFRVREEVLRLYAVAEQRFVRSFRRPDVCLDLNGMTAGLADYRQWRLRFNRVLLEENREHFMANVLPHEVAHLLVHELYGPGVRPHGREWQRLMLDVFGVEPVRTHRYDVRRAARLEYIYQCGCPDKRHAFTIRRHNKVLKGTRYLCRACRSELRFLAREARQTG